MWVGRTSSAEPRRGRRPRPPPPVIPPRAVPEVPHGGLPPGAERGSARRLVDLSLSVNPYGPPPFLAVALRRARRESGHYPDRRQTELTSRVADRLGVRPEEVLLAGSASELLRSAISAFGTRREVVLPAHTYEEYGRVARSVGARVRPVPMPGLCLDPDAFADAVPRNGLAVLANPGTPEGRYLPPSAIARVVSSAEHRRALLVVDESYLPFVRRAASAGRSSDSVLVVFSWSKTLGTPGLPVGHAVGAPPVLAALRTHLLPWTVTAAAHQIGGEALAADDWVERTLARVRSTADVARARVRSTSDAHYFAIDVGNAARASAALAQRGYWVRDLTSMGLPRHIRFAVRRPTETARFLEELAALPRPRGRETGR